MKAAILKSRGDALVVDDVPAPVRGSGEVIVEIAAAKVLAYAGDVFRGVRPYLFETPLIPGTGGVGRVVEVGLDATQLAVGDWVICDPTVRARDNAVSPTIVLQGLTAGDEPGRRLQRYVPDGSWAERVRVPTENAVPLGPIEPGEATAWATLGQYLVPFGGLLAAGVAPGDVVLINGATGAFGSAGVAVALALGAACVIATGRNRGVLDGLQRRFGARVRTVAMASDEAADRQRVLDAAPGPIDCVLDILPPAASAAQVRAAVLTVRPGGQVVLMGGVQHELALPYAWLMRYGVTVRGQWMYPRTAVSRLIAMVRAGLLQLDARQVTTFPLAEANAAVAHAAAHAGPFEATLICPSGSAP